MDPYKKKQQQNKSNEYENFEKYSEKNKKWENSGHEILRRVGIQYLLMGSKEKQLQWTE
jgi:hypothetical protein